MNLDDFKPQWQQRQRDLDGSVDHVIEKVRIRMSSFDRTIWWRDMRESFAAIGLIVYYIFCLFHAGDNWLWACGAGLGILACIFIVGVLHWARRKGKAARKDLPVKDYSKAEVTRVDRQIWLLKNVHWWYLGPIFIAIIVQIAGIKPEPGGLIMLLTFVLPLFGFVYWLNQFAVRFQLRPLRNELASAMDVDEESASTLADSELTLAPASKKPPLKKILFAVCGLLLVAAIGECLSDFVGVDRDAPSVSPFSEVRFEQSQVIVTYQKQAYQWLELDGIKVEDISSTAKMYYWGNWQKRVREDVGDVLWKMGHEPGDTVELRLRNLETNEQRVVENAPISRFAVDSDPTKVSPFTEVRFEDSQVIVTYRKQTYQWLELDGIKVEDITSAAKQHYRGRWLKRVSEDLVEVLGKMGHEPGDSVELRLRNLETSEQQVFENAPMTRANRNSVCDRRDADEKAAAKAQNHDEPTKE